MMKRLLILAAVLVLGACANDETIEPPAELVEFQQQAHFEQVWSQTIGDLDPVLVLGLEPASDGENVYAADHEGAVHAFRLNDGEPLWKYDTSDFNLWGPSTAMRFSAGPAVGNGGVVVGSLDGDVLMLDAASGEKRWQVNVDGELLSPPLITIGLVVVHTTDGRVIALDASTGARRWDTVREVPALTIRGLAAPATDGRRIFAGFDNGKVAALTAADGNMIWETTVSTPVGASVLEEIVDVDGNLLHFDQEIYATSYNGHVAALAAESGEILWRRELSSVLTPVISRGDVFVTDIDGVVHAYDRLAGTTVWTQDKVRARHLTAPAVFGDLLVVGDFEGYLHFFDIASGAMIARIPHGGEPVRAQPLVVGERLVVLSGDGELAAYRRVETSDSE